MQSTTAEPWGQLLAEELRRDLSNARHIAVTSDRIVLTGYLGTAGLEHHSTLRAAEVTYHLVVVGDMRCLLRDERALDASSNALTSRQLVATGIASFQFTLPGTAKPDEGFSGGFRRVAVSAFSMTRPACRWPRSRGANETTQKHPQSVRPMASRAACAQGFVLLMSLVLIALVGILLVGLARHSLLMAAETHEAKGDLQRRWGTLFLSRVLLSDPEVLISRRLDAPEAQRLQLPICESLPLGELTFRVTLDDESRKLNINRLRDSTGTQQVLETVHRFAGGAARVELRPVHATTLGVREFDSWGQVLQLSPSDNAQRQFDQLQQLSQGMTCWGSAKVNVHRGADEVLRSVGALAAGPITANRLVALRENDPQLGRDELLTKLALNGRKLALLKGWLSDDSDCYSLWILAGERRASLDLLVRENAGSESHTVKHFRW